VTRSASVSHAAFAGRSVSQSAVTTPRTTAGIASTMNIVCHPFNPAMDVPSSAAEIGPPTTLDTGTATRNMLMTRARTADGNQ
jgi:hypothetical protein